MPPLASDDPGSFGSLTSDRLVELKRISFRYYQRIIWNPRRADEWHHTLLYEVHKRLFAAVFPVHAGVRRTVAVTLKDLPVPSVARLIYVVDDIARQAARTITESELCTDPREKTAYVMVQAADFHAKCVVAQPFIDGNKRWAYFCLAALLVDCGFWPGTWLGNFDVDQERAKYLALIERACSGQPEPLAEHIIRGWLATRRLYRRHFS